MHRVQLGLRNDDVHPNVAMEPGQDADECVQPDRDQGQANRCRISARQCDRGAAVNRVVDVGFFWSCLRHAFRLANWRPHHTFCR